MATASGGGGDLPAPPRHVLWRRLDVPGAEHFVLAREPQGWSLAGTFVLRDEGGVLSGRYRIAVDDGWRTRAVAVDAETEAGLRSLELTVEAGSRWMAIRDGGAASEVQDVRGCLDVDLSVTPSTNVLPIRRLGLAVGEDDDVQAAWILFPGLEVRRLVQRYTRLEDRRFRYESASGFRRDLDVDADGLVVTYPGLWDRPADTEPLPD